MRKNNRPLHRRVNLKSVKSIINLFPQKRKRKQEIHPNFLLCIVIMSIILCKQIAPGEAFGV